MTIKELIHELTQFHDMNAEVLIDVPGSPCLEEPVSFNFEPSLFAVVIGTTKHE